MIDETISKIEERIKGSKSIKEENRKGLLDLLSELKSEVSTISDENKDAKDQANLSLEGAASTIEKFESSHPKLVRIVNAVADLLAKSGV